MMKNNVVFKLDDFIFDEGKLNNSPSSKVFKDAIDSNVTAAIDGLIISAKKLSIQVHDTRKNGFGLILFKLTDTPEDKDMLLVEALISTGFQYWPGKGYWR